MLSSLGLEDSLLLADRGGGEVASPAALSPLSEVCSAEPGGEVVS